MKLGCPRSEVGLYSGPIDGPAADCHLNQYDKGHVSHCLCTMLAVFVDMRL